MASGKFVFRAGPQLHALLQRYARSRRQSLNAACVELLTRGLEQQGPPAALPFGLSKLLEPSSPVASGVLGIILYGSAARGENTVESDVDVLVALDDAVPLSRVLYHQIDRLMDDSPSVSVMLAHLPRPGTRAGSLWLEVAQDGQLLFDKDMQVSRALSRLRREIASGRVVRRESHGQGYWVYAQ